MFPQLALFSLLATSVIGQSAYTDAKSGISFSQWSSPKLSFGMALPKDAKADFIGQIVRLQTA
jgi:hypothetical protein